MYANQWVFALFLSINCMPKYVLNLHNAYCVVKAFLLFCSVLYNYIERSQSIKGWYFFQQKNENHVFN